jgi:hypothetical protein
MTDRDIAILKLMHEAIDARNAEAFTELWRRFADWHGLNPDAAVVLQEREAMDAAGLAAADRVRAMVMERTHKKSVH